MIKHVAAFILALGLTYCQTAVQPQPPAQVSPLLVPASPLAVPAMRQQALLMNLQVADAPVEPALRCGLNATADALAEMILEATWQARKALVCDYRLSFAAQSKAESMAKGDWVAHTSPSGETPNELIRRFGCKLPERYERKGNQTESLVYGSPDPALSLQWLLQSPAHRRHIAGESTFFGQQDRLGVGFAQTAHGASRYQFYYVILTAECND